MPRKKKVSANLFRFEANLLQNGNIELLVSSPDDKEVEKLLAEGMPEYSGSHAVASVMRYLRSMGDEMLEKSGKYVY